jgi:hypothetical protein
MAKVTSIDSPKRRKPRVRRQEGSPRSDQSQSLEVWEKATKAYQMLVGGILPSEVCKELEIDSKELGRLLDERYAYDASYLTDRERKSILGLELIRLEHLQAAVWPSAMMGDPKSIDSAIKIIQTRVKITGLEQVDPVVNKNLVLVMGDKEQDYIASLKAAGTQGED